MSLYPGMKSRGAALAIPQPSKWLGIYNQGFFVDGLPHVLDSSDGGATCTSRSSFAGYTPHNTAMFGAPDGFYHAPTGKIWWAGSRGITTTDWQGTSIEVAYMVDADHMYYDSSPDFAALTSGGSAQQVWADGWSVDPNGQVYMGVLAIPNATSSPLQCYSYQVPVTLTTSPITVGTPIGPISGTGFPQSILNPAIRWINGIPNYFYKNDDSGQKNYEIATRSSVGASGWTVIHGQSVGDPDYLGWGRPEEALAFMDMPDRLRAFLDPQGNGCQFTDSMSKNPLGPWTTPKAIVAPFKLQHGNFVPNPWS